MLLIMIFENIENTKILFFFLNSLYSLNLVLFVFFMFFEIKKKKLEIKYICLIFLFL